MFLQPNIEKIARAQGIPILWQPSIDGDFPPFQHGFISEAIIALLIN